MTNTETGTRLKLRLLSLSKKELFRDLDSAIELPAQFALTTLGGQQPLARLPGQTERPLTLRMGCRGKAATELRLRLMERAPEAGVKSKSPTSFMKS